MGRISLVDLKQRSDKDAVLNQFLQAPDEQRGRLFRLDLNVRRVLAYDAPANDNGINRVYEIWGWTTESKAWLYVVVTPHTQNRREEQTPRRRLGR